MWKVLADTGIVARKTMKRVAIGKALETGVAHLVNIFAVDGVSSTRKGSYVLCRLDFFGVGSRQFIYCGSNFHVTDSFFLICLLVVRLPVLERIFAK